MVAGVLQLVFLGTAIGLVLSSILKEKTLTITDYCTQWKSENLLPASCLEVICTGGLSSGVYIVYPSGIDSSAVQVLCDQKYDGGGWTIIQGRTVGDTNFHRPWNEYKIGFGDLQGDFWLGNDNIASITNTNTPYELQVEMTPTDGRQAYAHYNIFSVGEEITNYYLNISGYSGTAGDSLISGHHGSQFSTSDRDNDLNPTESCADLHTGGWWFQNCANSNLNGIISNKNMDSSESKMYVLWQSLGKRPVKSIMMIRPHL